MKHIKRIYQLLLQNNGLKIREISELLELSKSFVADTLFSSDGHKYWLQDDNSAWHAIEGALIIEEPTHNDSVTISIQSSTQRKGIIRRYLEIEQSENIRVYLNEISHFRALSNTEILELYKRYNEGDSKSFELIVNAHLMLVVSLAYLYRDKGVPFEDLIQEGNIGLIKAVKKFSESKSLSFYNYAKQWILQSIWNALNIKDLVHVPLNQKGDYNKIQKYENKYELEHGTYPSIDEIINATEIDDDTVRFFSNRPTELHEQYINLDFDTLESGIPIAAILFEDKEYNRWLCNNLLNMASSKQSRRILIEYFQLGNNYGIPITRETLGTEYDLSSERVRQIIVMNLKKIKEKYDRYNANKHLSSYGVIKNTFITNNILTKSNAYKSNINSHNASIENYENVNASVINKETNTNIKSLKNTKYTNRKQKKCSYVNIGEFIGYKTDDNRITYFMINEYYNNKRIQIEYLNGVIDNIVLKTDRIIKFDPILQKYAIYFIRLHTNKTKGIKAPHKVILLLCVIELIETKQIKTNEIVYSHLLEKLFLTKWKHHVRELDVYANPKASTPYWHMHSEPFWKLVPYVGGEETIASLQKGNPYSSRVIRTNIRHAEIDKELFELLQNKSCRETLKEVLIKSIKSNSNK